MFMPWIFKRGISLIWCTMCESRDIYHTLKYNTVTYLDLFEQYETYNYTPAQQSC